MYSGVLLTTAPRYSARRLGLIPQVTTTLCPTARVGERELLP